MRRELQIKRIDNKDKEYTLKSSSLMMSDRDHDRLQQISARSKTNLTAPPKAKMSLWQRFVNLPINRKHLSALIVSELAILFGLGIGSSLIISRNFQVQSLKQAKSEISITDSNYNLKLNQMGFAFSGHSNNTAIIKAAELDGSGQKLTPELESQVKQILRNEVKNLRIEYATLVGTDGRIIVNANSNRQGEFFNPNGLVSEVLKNSAQIKANAIVSWSELEKEAPPLPPGFNKQDALIRYTFTPVKSPNQNKVIGVLVSGDIVNGKQVIVEKSLQYTDEGYSAVFLHKGEGNFVLATNLQKGEGATELSEAIRLDLTNNKSILTKAATNHGKTVTGHMTLGNQTYTIAAKSLPNKIITEPDKDVPFFNHEPVAILVQGSSEYHLQNLLMQTWLIQILVGIFALVVVGIWVYLLKRTIIKPIEQLKQTTEKFAQGDRTVRAKIHANDELGQLASSFNQMADKIVEKAIQQENQAKLAQLVHEMNSRVRGSLHIKQILNAAVVTTREAIQADRVIVYRFDENWYGKIVAESVDDDWPMALGAEIADPCFAKDYVEKYQRGRVHALENIYEANLDNCYLAQLAAFEVRANLVAPILLNNKLYGLLIAHQCSGPRQWQESEINLFQQVAIPIGYALEQAYLLEQVEQARSRAELIANEQSQQKQMLQQQVLKLLTEFEAASRGDLTVRADVTHGVMGTVADFFNSIVENLREIVTKVKASAIQVNGAVGENQGAISKLTKKAIKQATEISHILDSVENMTFSIATVAENAQKAAQIAHTASCNAQESGAAMDLTVQNIFNLRSTIDNTAKKVKRLGEASQQISRVVSLINDIAIQTNLLAFNAGLEAEKADTGSRGFVVVAAEVGELAARCSDATQEIKQLVENIQRETYEVVRAMEHGTVQVMEGSRIVEGAKSSLNQILSVSHQIDELVQSISLATVSQVETSRAVTKLMTEISQASELTSTSSRQISHSLQQTVEISQELQASVAKFKV